MLIDRTRPISFFRKATSLTSRWVGCVREKSENEKEREEENIVDRVDDCLASRRWIFKRSKEEESEDHSLVARNQ